VDRISFYAIPYHVYSVYLQLHAIFIQCNSSNLLTMTIYSWLWSYPQKGVILISIDTAIHIL
ncbi:hypothetical protein BDB01DRAFT_809627, partial [Pilobolus umbonatus]